MTEQQTTPAERPHVCTWCRHKVSLWAYYSTSSTMHHYCSIQGHVKRQPRAALPYKRLYHAKWTTCEMWEERDRPRVLNPKPREHRHVVALTPEGVKTFSSAQEAADYYKVRRKKIYASIEYGTQIVEGVSIMWE